jgi:hypothetical protein
MKKFLFVFFLFAHFFSYGQYTGAKPYIAQFGPNQYVHNSGAGITVTNLDENDMVIVLVDKSTDKAFAHAFIASRDSYTITDLPTVSFYYKFENNGDFFENKTIRKFDGCDSEKYMCDGYIEWELKVEVIRTTGYSNGKISKKDFFN